MEVNRVPSGNWVLIEGIDQTITKTATLAPLSGYDYVSLIIDNYALNMLFFINLCLASPT